MSSDVFNYNDKSVDEVVWRMPHIPELFELLSDGPYTFNVKSSEQAEDEVRLLNDRLLVEKLLCGWCQILLRGNVDREVKTVVDSLLTEYKSLEISGIKVPERMVSRENPKMSLEEQVRCIGADNRRRDQVERLVCFLNKVTIIISAVKKYYLDLAGKELVDSLKHVENKLGLKSVFMRWNNNIQGITLGKAA